MKNQFLDNNVRKSIIEAYKKGHTAMEIANFLGFKRTTVFAVIKKYTNGESVTRKLKGGARRTSLTPENKQLIKQKIDENSSITLRGLKVLCESEMGLNIGKSTIARCVSSFHYTLKRTHLLPERRNCARTIDIRANYAREFMELLSNTDDSKIFFLDEVGFSISMRSRRGRSLVGSRAIQNVTSLRSRNISVCCAISKNGILTYKSQERAFNTETFSEFVANVIFELNQNGISGAYLVMDNVPCHKSSQIEEMVVESGNHVKFLPPHSPFLNPIENMFSKWKEYIRASKVNNEVELLNVVEIGSELISTSDCNGYFRHIIGFLPKCFMKDPIVEE